MNKQILANYVKETFDGKITAAENKKLQDTQPRIYNSIFEYTDFLPPSASFTERCFNLENDINERTTCGCGKILKFKSYASGYGVKCSPSCKG